MVERERFVAYVTKYALTSGMWSGEVELDSNISDTMVSVVGAEWSQHYHGNDWHRTEASAKARAEQMRVAKIASLEKQIARVRSADNMSCVWHIVEGALSSWKVG